MIWRRISDSVRNIDGCGTGFDHGLNNLTEKIDFSAGGIFGREFHIWAEILRVLHTGHSPGDNFLLVHPQFELAVNGTGGKKDVDARLLCVLECLPGTIDIGIVAAC